MTTPTPTTTTTTSTTAAANGEEPLQAYFASLLGGKTLLGEIVFDNAKTPEENLTKTYQRRQAQQEEDDEDCLEPDERFSFLPSRWEAQRPCVPKPTSLPKRQVSIDEMPFSDDDDEDESSLSDYSNSDHNDLLPTRWAVSKFQPLPKFPERSRMARSDSYNSLSSSSSHTQTKGAAAQSQRRRI